MTPGDELLPPEGPVPPGPDGQLPLPGETSFPDEGVPPGEGEPAPRGEEAPPAPPETADRARWVAVLIMVVTLLGAVFTFLQNAASNRGFSAARRSDVAAVEAEAEAVRAAQRIAAQWRIWVVFLEEGQMAVALRGSGDPAAGALAEAYQARAEATAAFAGFDLQGEFAAEWQSLFEQTWSATLRAGELQKAHAGERSAWGAKGSQYVAVIAVLAVALFLLGLSRTSVGATHGSVLVWSGLAVAGAAGIWGLTVLLRPVAPPSTEAIDAFVQGQVIFGSATDLEEVRRAEVAYSRALDLRPGYSEAHFGRGLARSSLDLFRPGGPQGSEGARDDFTRVVALDPLNPVAWNNLGAARFWLGDLEGAVAAVRRAAEIAPDDPLAGLNLAWFLLVSGDSAGYERQLAGVRTLLGSGEVHEARRAAAVANVLGEIELAQAYRPAYAESARRAREDLLQVGEFTP